MKQISRALLFVLLTCSCSGPEPADYVNPFIGSSTNLEYGEGKTFPGATTPWGMVQVSPNTIDGGDNAPGYSCEHETIEGFAFTQMSGVGWYGDFGNLLIMPTTGSEMKLVAGKEDGSISGWRSRFDKKSETAKAGYYSALLTDYDILAECTAAPHGGVLRFTFPETDNARIQIDFARRVAGCSKTQYVKVVDDHTLEGWMYCPPECGGWGNGDGNADYTLYFHVEFSRPFSDYGFWSADIPLDWKRKREEVVSPEYLARVEQSSIIRDVKEIEGSHLGFYTRFSTGEGDQVIVSAGISYVDIDGARKNFKADLEGKSFDNVASEARRMWNDALGKMSVSGGTEDDKVIFYTALYHTMIDPRLTSDVDGRYIGGDGNIHISDGKFEKRTIFSGWDVFRSQMPLMTLIYPNIINDQINSLITIAEESGKEYFERWEIVNAYSGCMVGNPALPVIADAYAKGIRTFDAQKAFRYGANSSAILGIDPALGYKPCDISQTLEYGYADWCLGRFAEMLGKTEEAAFYYANAQAYRRIFDPEKGWFRPRNEDGSWCEWTDKGRLNTRGCVESNAYQQGWFVPHDIDGLTSLVGGKDAAIKDLVRFFEQTPGDFHWNDYYNHANEPVHWVPFIFNRLGEPRLTQKWTRAICSGAYHNNIKNGLCGNDDCGQMSAWYVLAASGIHPACPGENSYEITSPVFDRIEMTLPSGKTFTVIAHDNSPENIYIAKASLNGNPLDGWQIDYDEIMAGSTLELWMTDK